MSDDEDAKRALAEMRGRALRRLEAQDHAADARMKAEADERRRVSAKPANARRRQRREEKRQAETAARRAEAMKNPYEFGRGEAYSRLACLKTYNAAPPCDMPYAKGSPEEAEFDRGWKAVMKAERADRGDMRSQT